MDYFTISIAFILAVHVLHTFLDLRQYQALQKKKPPAQLAKLFSMDLYRSAQSYSLDKWWYNFAKGFYTLAETLIVLCSGMLPWLWGFISRVSPGIDDLGEIPHTIIFVLILTLGSTLTSLPWSAYFIFVIEQKHGFNKQTRSVFIGDTLTTVMLTVLLLPPVVAIFTFILLNTGPWVPMYLWLFILGVSLFMMAIYPVVIAPLFNKYELLPEGSLKVSIEALASSLSFPLKKLYSMDGSKRSGHANAYMYGFGSNKRIVVYDTLMKDCSEDQVVAVLAHELGHWKLRHTPMMFAAQQVIILSQFALFTLIRNSGELYTSFGFTQERPAFLAFVLFQLLVAPLDEVIRCLTNLVSRRFEFQADSFAIQQGKGADLRAALLALEKTNKASMNTDPWYSAYHYSHPPLEERLAAIDAQLKKAS